MARRFELVDHHRLWRELRMADGDLTADIYTNLVYMPVLEDGHSRQAPNGMVDINLANGAQMLNRTADRALRAIAAGADPDREMVKAVNEAALFLLREIVVDTPIDTGRARASWQIELADHTHHDSVSLGLTPPEGTGSARRDARRARSGRRGVRRRIDLGG